MKYLQKIENLNRFDKLNEMGRSMVEILGMLAVIGILSIIGIWEYTYAMNRYRANDILNAVNMRGEDTWNRYQEKSLPNQIDEWDTQTETGFPIRIVPMPDEIEPWYQVVVSDVSPEVCKMVLLSQFDSILARVAHNQNIYTYTNDVSICDTIEKNDVDMIFIWSLNSETSKTKPQNNMYDTPCVSQSECAACEWCNTGKYICESNCPNEAPHCKKETGSCVVCNRTEDCSNKQICNDMTNTCETLQEDCPESQFRSKNGACIPCDYAGNIEIDKNGIFGIDTITGEASCNTCAESGQPRIVEGTNEKSYCSYTCTEGISYQSRKNGCISCSEKIDYSIENETESKSQCLACSPNHTTYKSAAYPYNIMCGNKTCETGYFKRFDIPNGNFYAGDGERSFCTACSEYRNERVPISNSVRMTTDTQNQFINLCNNCPKTPQQERFYYKPTKEVTPAADLGHCYPKCIQPDENNSINACKNDGPTATTCTRQFQDQKTGNCLPCNEARNIYVGTSGPFYESCLKCNRTVTEGGYCVLPVDDECSRGTPGYFRSHDHICYSCDETGVKEIVSETQSGCVSRCQKNASDEYDNNGTKETRWVIDISNGRKFCAPLCAGKGVQFQAINGKCYNCSDNNTGAYVMFTDDGAGKSTQLQELCSGCTNMEVTSNLWCSSKECPDDHFHAQNGTCLPCTQTKADAVTEPNTKNELYIRNGKECEACDNRILVYNMYCAYVNPGNTGVCNSVENGKFANYTSGDGILFRDYQGNCRKCTDENSYKTTQAQCESCGNRRFKNNICQKGLCTSGTAFLDTASACVSCTEGEDKTIIPNTTEAIDLCNSCADKRVMTVEDNTGETTTACITDCAGEQWQTLNGKCLTCSEMETSVVEIGTDEKSRAQCTNCNRVAYSIKEGNQTKWYCSQYPGAIDGINFINKSGAIVECETTQKVEILNTAKAMDLCNACPNHGVKRDDNGVPYCELTSN